MNRVGLVIDVSHTSESQALTLLDIPKGQL